ncbi:hypothetical protein RHGRI_000122 [Rhododendron griersonianum]|uniref:TFIIB-type domain-containing protein n=1 Tax=Rhododendron griersonianum TaxID=479676 RepID=A0AAV6LIL0_9ERIC|nr:hypothetical protein RHGRI_000122 [Rhododendron griersonianum]
MAGVYCSDCKRATEVVFDHLTGDIVCSECGLVLPGVPLDQVTWNRIGFEPTGPLALHVRPIQRGDSPSSSTGFLCRRRQLRHACVIVFVIFCFPDLVITLPRIYFLGNNAHFPGPSFNPPPRGWKKLWSLKCPPKDYTYYVVNSKQNAIATGENLFARKCSRVSFVRYFLRNCGVKFSSPMKFSSPINQVASSMKVVVGVVSLNTSSNSKMVE